MAYYPPPGGYPPYAAPPPPVQESMSGGQIAGLLALSCCIPFLGPVISLTIGIAQSRKSGAVAAIIAGGAMLLVNIVTALLFLSAIPSYQSVKDKANEAELKANLYNIQLSVERFAVDHSGKYPVDFDEILSSKYLDSLPRNPFAKGQTMQEAAFDAGHHPGSFTYILHKTGKGENYYLILYGAQEQETSLLGLGGGSALSSKHLDRDIDGDGKDDCVILVLSSDQDYKENLKSILKGGG